MGGNPASAVCRGGKFRTHHFMRQTRASISQLKTLSCLAELEKVPKHIQADRPSSPCAGQSPLMMRSVDPRTAAPYGTNPPTSSFDGPRPGRAPSPMTVPPSTAADLSRKRAELFNEYGPGGNMAVIHDRRSTRRPDQQTCRIRFQTSNATLQLGALSLRPFATVQVNFIK